MAAILSEVFIDAGEFETVSGAAFDVLADIHEALPDIDDTGEAVALALHGAMLTLLCYPHHQEQRWEEFIPVPPRELFGVHQRWMRLKGWPVPDTDHPGLYFFELLR